MPVKSQTDKECEWDISPEVKKSFMRQMEVIQAKHEGKPKASKRVYYSDNIKGAE